MKNINSILVLFLLISNISFANIYSSDPQTFVKELVTDAIKKLIYKDNKFYGNIFKGTYLDCGTLQGYIDSGLKINKR